MMTLTSPTKSTMAFLRLREERCEQLRRSLRAKGIRIRPPHSKAFIEVIKSRLADDAPLFGEVA